MSGSFPTDWIASARSSIAESSGSSNWIFVGRPDALRSAVRL